MPLLRNTLGSKTLPLAESNLETGRIFAYQPGTANTHFPSGCFKWNSPGTGTVLLEIWGASGSSSRLCCCGVGLPGNPGAYSSRSFSVTSGCFICGCVGFSCRSHSTLNFHGCSNPTMVCWSGSGTTGCMCAEGGAAGCSIDFSSGSNYCCYVAQGFCNTNLGTGCGIICNRISSTFIPSGYGGTTNLSGGFSCMTLLHCNPCCFCCIMWHVTTSPRVFSTNGAVISHKYDNGSGAMWGASSTGGTLGNFIFSLHAASRDPNMGVPYKACWSGDTFCSCYEAQGCVPLMPYGVPGPGVFTVPNVRDVGQRGGYGLVRITYNGTGI